MKFKYLLATSVVGISAAAAVPAAAQSTGSVDFDESNVIIVSGARATDVGGVDIPDSPKAKVQLDLELIMRQPAGQTINETLNLVPGVSFTNNDPFGSLGGSFTIRGFSSDRISQTFDGIPLNDSGNYALYTNQMLDPEIIKSATVSLGSTDVDSPTASAAGGTINLRSKTPDDEFGVITSLTYGNIISRGDPGNRMMYRFFAKVETGELTAGGLKAYLSASKAGNDSVSQIMEGSISSSTTVKFSSHLVRTAISFQLLDITTRTGTTLTVRPSATLANPARFRTRKTVSTIFLTEHPVQ